MNAFECMNLGWRRAFLINVVHRWRFLSILGAWKVPSPFFHSQCILTVLYGFLETLAIETHRSFRLSFHYTFRNRIGLIWASFLSHLETVEIASWTLFLLKNGYFVRLRSLRVRRQLNSTWYFAARRPYCSLVADPGWIWPLLFLPYVIWTLSGSRHPQHF